MPEPATSQLTKPWSRGQRRSCITRHCLIDQPILSKEVKDQEGRRLMIFQGGGREGGRKGQKRAVGQRERALARSLLKPAAQLHLCSSSAAKHQWTWANGTLRGGVGKSCVSQCVWEFARCRHQKPLDKGSGVVIHCKLVAHQCPPQFRVYHCIYCGVAYN